VSRGSTLLWWRGRRWLGRGGGPGGGPGGFGMLAVNKCLEPSASGVHSGFYVAAKTLGGYPPRTITFFLEEPGLASGVRGRMRQEFLGRLGRALRNWFDEERGASSFQGHGPCCSHASTKNTSYKKDCVSLPTRTYRHQAAAQSRAIYLNRSRAALRRSGCLVEGSDRGLDGAWRKP